LKSYHRQKVGSLIVVILQVEELIGKFAKKGATPSQIGVMLRDSHGVPQVNGITGSKVLRILKKNGKTCCHLTSHDVLQRTSSKLQDCFHHA